MGSGFCPILSQRERRDGARRAPPIGGGRPRAMLAPDASVGKAEKNSDIAVYGNISVNLKQGFERYFVDSLLFDSCITVFELCDSVTGDSCGIHVFALSSCIFSRAFAFLSSEYGADMR